MEKILNVSYLILACLFIDLYIIVELLTTDVNIAYTVFSLMAIVGCTWTTRDIIKILIKNS